MPKKQEEFICRSISFTSSERVGPSTINKEKRSVRVALSTETPVREWDYEAGYIPTILLTSGAVLPPVAQLPLLDTHDFSTVKKQLGSLKDFERSGNELLATAYFSTIKSADEVFTMVCEGHVTDVSVRRKDHIFTIVPDGTTTVIEGKTFTGPVKVVTQWEVKEGSFTSIGADENAKARAASDGKQREENPMPKSDEKDKGRALPQSSVPASPPAEPAEQPVDRTAPMAVTAESHSEQSRAEMLDILTIARTHNCIELAEEALRSGTSLADFQTSILDHLATRSAKHAPKHMVSVEVGVSDTEKYRAATVDAILMRSGSRFAPQTPTAGADELRSFTLTEHAREALRRNGLSTAGDMDMVGRAFTTTSDYPAILADVASRSVLLGAQEAAETFDAWTGEVTVMDFRTQTGVALGAFSDLDVVPQGAEYKYGEFSDRGVRYQISTYGKLFSISRQAVINDNLNAFTIVPFELGRSSIRTCGNSVYGLLKSNPQMSDGYALFHAMHNNLAASASGINSNSFSSAITALGTQKGAQGEALNITPTFLLHGVGREVEAYTLLNSQVIGTQAQPNQANPWRGRVQPVSDARLDLEMGGAWFLMGPKGWGINTAWLGGNKTPRVEQRQGWHVDGTEFKVSLDFGCFVNDWRTLYKNAGA